MLPRMSNLYANGNANDSELLIKKSMKFIMFLSLPMMFGLMAISNDFSIIFFGDEFAKSGLLIILLTITIVFMGWGNVLRTQYLIPKEMDKEFIISAFLGAIVNLIANLLLIPKFQSVGASIGTILAELTVMLYQTIKVKKYLPIKNYLTDSFYFLISSIIMFIIIISFSLLPIDPIIKILIQIFAGIIVYCLLNIKYINSIINIKKLFVKKSY